ncbi:tetratricopeptide repeat protein [Aquimarina sp. D1M17]|uniref:tetratricopeptide repeat protein n=1 Tax=Aquimarina acroporae TaxID=2937283 RepID=UPI0020BD6258|nr:tetratricopeptide repeat protein [Aquimarina acroporae]MCK8521087.1 tetratricopeptide repeat protein [Aquimarina acroporae]
MRLSILISSLFSLSIQFLNAQNDKKLDSLLNSYKIQKDDSTKVNTLDELFDYYVYRDPSKAEDYAKKQLNISKKIQYQKGIAEGFYNLAISYNNKEKSDSAKLYYLESAKIYEQIQDFNGITGVNHGLAILEYSKSNYDKAIDLLDKNIQIYSSKFKDSSGLALTYDFNGMIHAYKGNYNIALQQVLKGLTIFETINDEIRMADALNHLANVEAYLENHEKAISYGKKALKIYNKNNDKMYASQALNDMGNSYFYLKDYDNAIKYLTKSLQLSREMQIRTIEASSLNNLGKSYTNIKQYDKAIFNLNKSLQILEQLGNKNKIVEVLNDLGKTYNEMDNFKLAMPILNRSIQLANELGVKGNLRAGYNHRSISYEKTGNYKRSLEDYKLYKSISDSIFNKTKSQQIEELKIIYETEKKEAAIALQEKEIDNLNKEVQISNLKNGLYAGGMVSFITISGLLFFGFRQRIKKNKAEREKQEEIYKQEIEFKKKELASQTLHLVQKNSFLQELKENLENLKNSPDRFKTEFRRIVMLLKKESASDKDWEVFKSYFSEVHDNFDQKLRKVYHEISEKEIRLASFLKMNLSTKEIADILNVLPDSVLKSKYRLKKKLHLDKETDLYDFLINL